MLDVLYVIRLQGHASTKLQLRCKICKNAAITSFNFITLLERKCYYVELLQFSNFSTTYYVMQFCGHDSHRSCFKAVEILFQIREIVITSTSMQILLNDVISDLT